EPDDVEKVAHRAVGAEVPAVLHEGAPHLGAGALTIRGHAFDHDHRAARAVAFVVHPLAALARLGDSVAAARRHLGTPLNVGPLAVACHERSTPKNRRYDNGKGGPATR